MYNKDYDLYVLKVSMKRSGRHGNQERQLPATARILSL